MPIEIGISATIGGIAGNTPGGDTPPFSNVNSFSFDGVDEHFLGTSTYSELDGQNNFTFSFWIKPTNLNNSTVVFSIGNNSSDYRAQQFYCYIRSNGQMFFHLKNMSIYCRTNSSAISANVWQHVLICRKSSAAVGSKAKIFVNSVDVTGTETTRYYTNTTPATTGLMIGEHTNSYLAPFLGKIDEFAIWNEEDLRNDVATIYNNGTPTDLNNNGLTAPTTWQRMGENATWNGAIWTMTDVNGGYTNRSANMVEANRTTDVPPNPFVNLQSILLDGVDDYVTMGAPSALRFNRLDSFSFSAWVNVSATGNSTILSNQLAPSTNYRGYYFAVQSNKLVAIFRSTLSDRLIFNGASNLLSGWNHVVFTYDGTAATNSGQFYINGSADTTTGTGALTGTAESTDTLYLGCRSNADNFFDGKVDETAIFTTELSQSDVTSIYNGGEPNDISSLSPISWWRFEGSGTTATDSGSGGNNGTLSNGVTRSTDVPTASSFANTKSILLDGVDDYVNVADNNNLSFGNGVTDSPFSISAWVKPVDNARFRIAFKWGTTLKEYYFHTAGGGALQVSLNSSSSVYIGRNGQTTISENLWSHVVFTYDGSGNKNNINVYLNGVLDNGTTISSGTYTAMSNTAQPFEIGRYNGGSYADGNVDETAVFNSELSASDVTSIYNGGEPNDISSLSPISWWRFEGSGTTAIDSGSGSNNGTLVNGVTRSTNVPPNPFVNTKSILLDGVDDYVNVADNNNLSFGNGVTDSPFSISTWVKMNDATKFRAIGKYGATNIEYLFATGGDDKVVFNLYDNSASARIGRQYSTAITSFEGQWIHLVATYNGNSSTSGLKIYLNGSRVDDTNSTLGTYVAMENTTQPLFIGKLTTTYADGNVDETAVFNTELSASDITTIYNGGVPNDISSLSPLSWWRCGDGDTSPTLTDNGSASNNGTMTNFTTFSTDVPT